MITPFGTVTVAFSFLATSTSANPDILVNFDASTPSKPETPESLVIDSNGAGYISLGLSGAVCKVESIEDSDSSDVQGQPCAWKTQIPIFDDNPLTNNCTLPPGFTGAPLPLILGIVISEDEQTLYASGIACNPANHGVWAIETSSGNLVGTTPQYKTSTAMTPSEQVTTFNGLAVKGDYIYAAEYNIGKVWRAPLGGNKWFVQWAENPLLLNRIPPFWGSANGIEFHDGYLYVSNSSKGTIIKITIGPNGQPKTIEKYFEFSLAPCCLETSAKSCINPPFFPTSPGEDRCDRGGSGACNPCNLLDPTLSCEYTEACDEFTLDDDGNIYCATAPYNRVLFINVEEDTITELLNPPME